VLGAIETTQTRVLRTPVHRAFQLYLETSQPVGVPVEHAGPSIETPGGRVDALDVVASRSEDRSALTIALINRMPGDPVTADIQLGDFVARGPVRVSALMADTPEATNTFEEPDRVTIKRWSISVDELRSLEVPPHTAMVLEMGRE
jgi:alpha-N-arabinofuranosidase